MSIQDIIEGKKQWRPHVTRVKALPPNYQIVYKEMQKYRSRSAQRDEKAVAHLAPGNCRSSCSNAIAPA